MRPKTTRRTSQALAQILSVIWLWIVSSSALAVDVNAQRQVVNQGVIGILTDGVRGSQIELMGDLATLLDDAYNMRILPMAGKGSVRNVEDLMLLRGVDIALVQADVLDFYRRADLFPDIDKKLSYIAKLYREEVHVLASKDIPTIQDLQGKKVNFGPASSGSFVTASLLFEQLGIGVIVRGEDYQVGLERLRQGEIDAWVRVGAKPLLQVESLPDWEDVHLLGLPPKAANDVYASAELKPKDYPNLIAEGSTIETVSVDLVMAVYNWSAENAKRRQLEAFSDRFLANMNKLQRSSFHPKWREVDFNAEVPGWNRF